jgi:putative sigma-54 modulation protein
MIELPSSDFRSHSPFPMVAPKEYIMHIRLITRHLDRTHQLVDFVHQRAGSALSRFRANVRQVDIRLSDVNGPRGGAGIACLAKVSLTNGNQVLVESSSTSPEHGIREALERLTHRLRRLFGRRQDHR